MGNRKVWTIKSAVLTLFISVSVFISCFYFSGLQDIVNAEERVSCVTDRCHDKMGKDKFVHGPAAVGQCTACHSGDAERHKSSPSRNKFAPITNVAEQCYKCHDRVDTKKGVHRPVREGKCSKCHDPHQSPYKFQLRKDGSNLCYMCHEKEKKEIVGKKFLHGPLAVGGCSMCHNPHQTDFPSMLRAEGNEACFVCHTDKADAFKGKRFVHKPVKDKCISCHSPHAGDYKYNFKVDGTTDLCLNCHKDKKEGIANAKVKHGGLDYEKKGLACHDPHVSDYVKQLVKQPVESCNICHDKALDGPNGKIKNMKDFLSKNKIVHGPIKQGDCSSCHNTHGSDNFRILRKYLNPAFYAPFDPKNYELCFNCHEKTLVLDPQTSSLTNFRNGDQNLHFVHVNKTVKGRTCRSCHDEHATNNPKHIRDEVPFGAWGLPVGFSKNTNGGSCLPGCHQRFGYDRITPVKNR